MNHYKAHSDTAGTTGDIRCVLYLRVSSPKQVKGVSLEDQEQHGRAHAARMGWTLTRSYIEPGRSAFTEDLTKRLRFRSCWLMPGSAGSMWCWSTCSTASPG